MRFSKTVRPTTCENGKTSPVRAPTELCDSDRISSRPKRTGSDFIDRHIHNTPPPIVWTDGDRYITPQKSTTENNHKNGPRPAQGFAGHFSTVYIISSRDSHRSRVRKRIIKKKKTHEIDEIHGILEVAIDFIDEQIRNSLNLHRNNRLCGRIFRGSLASPDRTSGVFPLKKKNTSRQYKLKKLNSLNLFNNHKI